MTFLLCCAAFVLRAQMIEPDTISRPDTLLATDTLYTMDSLDIQDTLVIDSVVPFIPYYTGWNESEVTDIEIRALDWCM